MKLEAPVRDESVPGQSICPDLAATAPTADPRACYPADVCPGPSAGGAGEIDPPACIHPAGQTVCAVSGPMCDPKQNNGFYLIGQYSADDYLTNPMQIYSPVSVVADDQNRVTNPYLPCRVHSHIKRRAFSPVAADFSLPACGF